VIGQYLARDLIGHIAIFQAVMLLILVSNIYFIHRKRRHKLPSKLPKVSIMVPARNEEAGIEACVISLLAQTYPDFELLVLDDQSTDATLEILLQLSQQSSRMKVLMGLPELPDLSGKNWACAQLAEQATGDLFFFTDADTVHQPEALAAIVSAMLGEKADLMTGFPHQVVRTWGERLLVPFFSWASLNFIPFGLAYWLRSTALTIAVGQVMVFTRSAYLMVGGHAALGRNILDDIVLARRIQSAKLNWRILHISDLVSCRMYRSSRDAVEGLTKNLFGAFGCRLLPYLFTFFWLVSMTWVPIVIFWLWFGGLMPQADPMMVLACLSFGMLTWMITLLEIRVPVWLTLYYPFIILANARVMLRSMVFSLRGNLHWKARPVVAQKWKWL